MKTRTLLQLAITLTLTGSLGACLRPVPQDDLGMPLSHMTPPLSSDKNALLAGELTAHPTITCIGVQWLVEGDADADATGTMHFREAGSKEWQQAFPLHRAPARPGQKVKFLNGLENWVPNFAAYGREQFNKNYLAGSIFNLKPGTKYELRIALHDPDGGNTTKNLTITTRHVPSVDRTILSARPYSTGADVQGGGDALKQAINKAVSNPSSNQMILVHAGKYNGDITIPESKKSGLFSQLTIIAAGDGEVLIDGGDSPANNDKTNGITITGENVRISGLTFRNFHTCIKAEKSAKNLVVTNCKLTHFYNGIHTEAEDSTITDNSLHESYNTLNMDIKGGDRKSCFGIRAGRSSKGAVIAYNQISLVSDALHAIGRDADVHNNDVIFCIDDAIELDFGGPNIRVYDNRFSFTGQNGISFQPYIGGPAYILRNLVAGQKENCIKNRYDSDSVYFVNNTFVSRDNNGNALPYGSFTRNNIFLVTPGKTRSAHIDMDADHLPPNMDYDAFGPVGPNALTLPEFTQKTGLEKHGIQVKSAGELLAAPPLLPAEYDTPQWIPPEPFIKATTRPHPDYSLAPKSPAIGAGTRLPNLTPPNLEKPDLGALQHNQPLPHYGPRSAK